MVVLRAETSVLYDRLTERCVSSFSSSPCAPFFRAVLNGEHSKYAEAKLQENLDSEIMEVLLLEAREAYDEQIVVELQSNGTDDLEANLERIEGWLRQWLEDNKGAEAG